MNITSTFLLAVISLSQGTTEIVVDKTAPKATLIAAGEMQGLLGKALGGEVPIVREPSAGKAAIMLGTNAWSRAAGLRPETLRRDGFRILAKGGRIYIAGCDSTLEDPENVNFLGEECMWQPQFERGTLFGVYAFLERLAGCRFYFPGELGTIVPRRERLDVPDADITEEPDFTVRRYGYQDGEVPPEMLEGLTVREFKRLNFYRLRGETEYIPCCHGQNKLFIPQRFPDHPEYRQLDKDGKRCPPAAAGNERPTCSINQLCQSSIWEEIYKDAKSYFSGEPASVRKIPALDGNGYAWGRNASARKYLDVMPHDGARRCVCEKCTAAYRDSEENYASDLIWRKIADTARRLKADGLNGHLTMMSYFPYARVPDFDLPDNIDVMVARQGPWCWRVPSVFASHEKGIRNWTAKLGHKVWLWNYIDKVPCGGTAIPGAPCISPRAVGAYYKAEKDLIFGAFAESEAERWLYQYLNYCVFARVAWDNSTDVDAYLDEHYRLMFGAGADDMKRFFDTLEDCWVGRVTGTLRDTPLGPACVKPSPADLWADIYSPAVMERLDGFLSAAYGKAAAGSLEARRVALMRRHIYEPLAKRPSQFAAENSVEAELERRRGRTVKSILRNGDFSSLDGWIGESLENGSIALATDQFVSAPSSLKITVTAKPAHKRGTRCVYATQMPDKLIEKLKPNTKYRISYFIKCDNLDKYLMNGGLYIQWWDNRYRWVPKTVPLAGNTGWMHQSFEMSTPGKFDDFKPHSVQIFITGCIGSAYIDDLLIEEVSD